MYTLGRGVGSGDGSGVGFGVGSGVGDDVGLAVVGHCGVGIIHEQPSLQNESSVDAKQLIQIFLQF